MADGETERVPGIPGRTPGGGWVPARVCDNEVWADGTRRPLKNDSGSKSTRTGRYRRSIPNSGSAGYGPVLWTGRGTASSWPSPLGRAGVKSARTVSPGNLKTALSLTAGNQTTCVRSSPAYAGHTWNWSRTAKTCCVGIVLQPCRPGRKVASTSTTSRKRIPVSRLPEGGNAGRVIARMSENAARSAHAVASCRVSS